MIKKEDIVPVGHFAKLHGIKGDINLILSADVSFDEWDEPYIICETDGILVPFYLEEYRYKSDTTLFVKLENVDSDEAAREYTNREVFCPPGVVRNHDDDSFAWSHFIGYKVVDTAHGLLGEIINIDESTLNILFVINHKENELLIPATGELILSADHGGRQLTVELPDGLLDLQKR
ncbi:MAG: ribosome maturation factor RimM [Tannerellaceae bacterium]|jgi:16S rRNA processing protein RimM|nr:ribosome maturation factor RimM [Tannerellaceae bacterium]